MMTSAKLAAKLNYMADCFHVVPAIKSPFWPTADDLRLAAQRLSSPSTSAEISEAEAEIIAEAAYLAYWLSMYDGNYKVMEWRHLTDFTRKPWRSVAHAALEAAKAEIERLKDDFQRIQSVYDFAKQAAEIERLRSRNAELEALLKRTCDALRGEGHFGGPGRDNCPSCQAYEAGRAALSTEGDGQ